MKKTGRRNLSFLLAALLCAASALAGCGESAVREEPGAPAADEVSVPSAMAETVPETEETVLSDNVPELDFGGVTVTMAGQGTLGGANDLDIWVPELTGDVVRDAVFQRNIAMEERFNVSIAEPLMNDYTTVSNAVKASIRAGDGTYDFIANQLAQTSADVTGGGYMNLNEIPYLDFTMPWYPADVLESASLNGKLFLMVSDMCLTYVGQTWSICFNKDLTADLGIEGLYDTVREGEWTIDKLKSVTGGIYLDIDGNGERSEEDCYGFTMGSSGSINGCMGAAFLYGAGQRYLQVNEDGSMVHLLDSEHAQAVCEKFYELNHQESSFAYKKESWPIRGMMSRNAVFAPSELGHYYVCARDFEGTFGVLPLPKYDSAQEDYVTICDAGCNCLSVPITCRDPQLTGALIEAMSAYSANTVVPAYVDISLQTKVARDEESGEMMQIVMDSRVMDFGYLYCGWNGWTWQLANLFSDPGTYASNLQKNIKMMTKTYEKIIKMFME